MKPLIQKLPLDQNTSFVAKTFRTPAFEVGWHQHIEYELILFTEGSGLSFVGNHVGDFEAGDIYLLGTNLPHTFQKREPELLASAVVVQFREDFWGQAFLNIPESRSICRLLGASAKGLKIEEGTRQKLAPLIRALEERTEGFRRVLLLGECLELIAETGEFSSVSTQEVKQYNSRDAACIDRIFQFTIDSFKEPVALSDVASVACMSVSSFCNYFKRSTKKTYIDFLNEIRIGYACTLLQETHRPVLDICYNSGYNTLANFHKQFLKIKRVTPLQYRKSFSAATIGKGNNTGIVFD